MVPVPAREFAGLCPHAESPTGVKRDLRGNVTHPGKADPDKRAKESAKLIASTAVAYEQNGWAKDVRVEFP